MYKKVQFRFVLLIVFVTTLTLFVVVFSYNNYYKKSSKKSSSKKSASLNLISNPTFDSNIDGWYRFTTGIKRDASVYKGSSGASMYFPPNADNRTIN
ncbi:hypothetical protein LCGC14_3127270, partial [marine sediment metagenome]